MKKAIIALILLAAAGGGGYWYWTKSQKVDPPTIAHANVSRGNIIDTVAATGQLEPLERVQVGSQVSGQIMELHADFNSVVRKGQLLAKLDPKLIDTQILQSEANLVRSQTDVERNEVQLDDAKRKFERTKELFDKGISNRADYENADLQLKSATASLASSRASLKQSEASLEQQRVNRQNTEIYSPIDGIVISRIVDVGQTINAGQQAPTLFNLAADLAEMRVVAGIDEADIGRVRAQQHVTFRIDAYTNEVFTGTVQSVRLEARMQQNVVTYQAVITVPNPGLKLRPGMTANINIEISRKDDVIRVPNASLRFRPTSEMYVALGMEPPAEAGRGGRGGAGGRGGPGGPGGTPVEQGRGESNGQSTSATPGAPGAPAGQAAAPAGRSGSGEQPSGSQMARGGQNGGASGGRGGGRQMSQEERERMMAQMTPEQRERMNSGRGGRGGNGRGGNTGGRGGQNGRGGQGNQNARGGRGGANGGSVLTAADLASQRNVTTIDNLFPPLPVQDRPARVWTLTKEGEKNVLTPHNIRIGISDGNNTEVVQGDLTEGQQLVSNIIVAAVRNTGFGAGGNNPFVQGGRGGPGQGGRGPGGGGPGGGGGGGGGGPQGGGGGGGGGGNRGGGGGGGGRGGF